MPVKSFSLLSCGFTWDFASNGGGVGTYNTGLQFVSNTLFQISFLKVTSDFMADNASNFGIGTINNPTLFSGLSFHQSNLYHVGIQPDFMASSMDDTLNIIITIQAEPITSGSFTYYITYLTP